VKRILIFATKEEDDGKERIIDGSRVGIAGESLCVSRSLSWKVMMSLRDVILYFEPENSFSFNLIRVLFLDTLGLSIS
jgi:hypothetical protein